VAKKYFCTATPSLLNRQWAYDVEVSLAKFVESYANHKMPHVYWEAFYEFVCCCFRQIRERRPSVSQLSQYLKESNIESPGTFAVVYAHCLFTLAKNSNRAIYGEEFNV